MHGCIFYFNYGFLDLKPWDISPYLCDDSSTILITIKKHSEDKGHSQHDNVYARCENIVWFYCILLRLWFIITASFTIFLYFIIASRLMRCSVSRKINIPFEMISKSLPIVLLPCLREEGVRHFTASFLQSVPMSIFSVFNFIYHSNVSFSLACLACET